MKTGIWGFNGILIGLLAALLSGGLVLGSFVLSISEASQLQAPPGGITQVAARMTALPPLPTTALASKTAVLPSPSPTGKVTETRTPTATACPAPPPGWVAHDVPHNVKIKVIASNYGISEKEFREVNCLDEPGPWLQAGMNQIYVPQTAPTATVPPYLPPWQPPPTLAPPWPGTPFPTDTPVPPLPPTPGNISNSPMPPGPTVTPPSSDSSAP